MRKKLSNFIRILLAFMLLAGVAMYIFWMPSAVDYASEFFRNAESVKRFMYVISAIVALPIFCVAAVSFRFPTAIENDTIFGEKTAKLLGAIGVTVIADCLFFFVCTAWLFFAGERVLSPALAFVSAIGITVGLMLSVLSQYVKRVAALKEEADFTL